MMFARILLAVAAVLIAPLPAVHAEPGSGSRDEPRIRDRDDDRAGDRQDRADRDTDRASERADRDAERASDRASREEARYAEERAKILEDTGKDQARQQEELAKLDQDYAEEQAKIEEDAAKDAADYAEELAKIEEDLIEDAAEHGDDSGHDGSSQEMHDVAVAENADHDDRGFPVRQGEIVAMDLDSKAMSNLSANGFRLINEQALPALGSTVMRLAAPQGLDTGAALAHARRLEPAAVFDFAHYYAMQFAASGTASGPKIKGRMPRRSGRLTVGMIDTAVARHAALDGVAIVSKDFTPARDLPRGHGTAVASILASEGSSKLYVAGIFRGSAERPFTSADAITEALEWMVANRVPVVNMSLAGPRNAILDRLVAQAVRKGTLIVAAAGNGGPTAPPAYPAALGPVVAVTAVDARDRVYRYANQGRYITVAARGVDELAADARGGLGNFSGTSFATPHVTGWLARCLTRNGAAACVREMRGKAKDLGEPGFDPVYGHGLVE